MDEEEGEETIQSGDIFWVIEIILPKGTAGTGGIIIAPLVVADIASLLFSLSVQVADLDVAVHRLRDRCARLVGLKAVGTFQGDFQDKVC